MARQRSAGQTPDKPDKSGTYAPLNPRQRSFISEFIKDKNATNAYMRAYGVSRETADRAGPRLMGHVGVKAEIDRLLSEVVEQAKHESGITLERVLRELASLAFAAQDRPSDQLKALDMLMKHLGGYAKDNEHKVEVAETSIDRKEFARHLLFMLREAANDPNKPAPMAAKG